jgi:hypothetical protein
MVIIRVRISVSVRLVCYRDVERSPIYVTRRRVRLEKGWG